MTVVTRDSLFEEYERSFNDTLQSWDGSLIMFEVASDPVFAGDVLRVCERHEEEEICSLAVSNPNMGSANVKW
jgi:hypothetical protein